MKKTPKKHRIHFILTGGTIDSFYNPATETSVPNKKSVIPDYINDVVKPHFTASFQSVTKVDSRFMKDTHRRKIVAAIRKTKAQHILVVHGTSTMADTAKFIDKHLDKKLKKTIVLAGAMLPLKQFALSDGGFNLGYAIAMLECQEPGVYVCMNAKTFKAGETVKNVKQARFEKL